MIVLEVATRERDVTVFPRLKQLLKLMNDFKDMQLFLFLTQILKTTRETVA